MRSYLIKAISWALVFQLCFASTISMAQSSRSNPNKKGDISISNSAPLPNPDTIIAIARSTKVEAHLINNQVKIKLAEPLPTAGTPGEKFLGIMAAITSALDKQKIDLNNPTQIWQIEVPNTYCIKNAEKCTKTSWLDNFPISSAQAQLFDRNIIITVDPSQSAGDRFIHGFSGYFKGAYGSDNAVATFLNNMGFVLEGMTFRYIVEAIAVGITEQASRRLFAFALGTLAAIKLAEKAIEWTDMYNKGQYEALGADMAQFVEATTFFILGNLSMKEFIKACTRRGYFPTPKMDTKPSESSPESSSGGKPSGGGKPTVGGRTPSTSPRVTNAPKVTRTVPATKTGGSGGKSYSKGSRASGATATATMTKPVKTTTPPDTAPTSTTTAPSPGRAPISTAPILSTLPLSPVSSMQKDKKQEIEVVPVGYQRMNLKPEEVNHELAAYKLWEFFEAKAQTQGFTLGFTVAPVMKDKNGNGYQSPVAVKKIETKEIPIDLILFDWLLGYTERSAGAQNVGRAVNQDVIIARNHQHSFQNITADQWLGSTQRVDVVNRPYSSPLTWQVMNDTYRFNSRFYQLIAHTTFDEIFNVISPYFPPSSPDTSLELANLRDRYVSIASMRPNAQPHDPSRLQKTPKVAANVKASLEYFGDLTKEEHDDIKKTIEKYQPAAGDKQSADDKTLILKALSGQPLNMEESSRLKRALDKYSELCRDNPVFQRDNADFCNAVARLKSSLESAKPPVKKGDAKKEEKKENPADDVAWRLVNRFELLPPQKEILVSVLHAIHSTEELLYIEDIVNSLKNDAFLEEYFVGVSENVKRRTYQPYEDDPNLVPTQEDQFVYSLFHSITEYFNKRRSYSFKRTREKEIAHINQAYPKGEMKKLKKNQVTQDTGADVEMYVGHAARYLRWTGPDSSMASVLETIINIASAKQVTSIRKNILEDYFQLTDLPDASAGTFELVRWIKQQPILLDKKWSSLDWRKGKAYVFYYLFQNYFDKKRDTVVVPYFSFVEYVQSKGKPGIDLRKYLDSAEVEFAGRSDNPSYIEIKFRFGKSEKLTSSEVEEKIHDLMEKMKITDYGLHLHNVAPVPKSFEKALGKFALAEHYGRVDRLLQMSAVVSGNKLRDRLTFKKMEQGDFTYMLNRTLNSPDNELVLYPDNGYLFRITSFAALQESSKFKETDPFLYDIEMRMGKEKQKMGPLADAVQYNMQMEDYGLPLDKLQAWLDQRGVNLNNPTTIPFAQLTLDMHHDLSWKDLYRQLDDKVKSAMKINVLGKRIENEDEFEDYFKKFSSKQEEDGTYTQSGIKFLFHNWSRDPLFAQDPELVRYITAAQNYYILRLIMYAPAAYDDVTNVIVGQFLMDSGIRYVYYWSITQNRAVIIIR